MSLLRHCKGGTIKVFYLLTETQKGRYFVSVLCELEEMATKLALNKIGLGIDLGVKDFATRSDGIVHENINKTIKVKKIEKRLKREQRSLARKFENLKKEVKNLLLIKE